MLLVCRQLLAECAILLKQHQNRAHSVPISSAHAPSEFCEARLRGYPQKAATTAGSKHRAPPKSCHAWDKTPKMRWRSDWPRTDNKDVHKSSGACVPVRPWRQCRALRSRLNGFEVSTDALDCALHQRINSPLDLTAGTFIQLRTASDVCIDNREPTLDHKLGMFRRFISSVALRC